MATLASKQKFQSCAIIEVSDFRDGNTNRDNLRDTFSLTSYRRHNGAVNWSLLLIETFFSLSRLRFLLSCLSTTFLCFPLQSPLLTTTTPHFVHTLVIIEKSIGIRSKRKQLLNRRWRWRIRDGRSLRTIFAHVFLALATYRCLRIDSIRAGSRLKCWFVNTEHDNYITIALDTAYRFWFFFSFSCGFSGLSRVVATNAHDFIDFLRPAVEICTTMLSPILFHCKHKHF